MMIFLYEFDLLLLLPTVRAFTPDGFHVNLIYFLAVQGRIIAKLSPALPTVKTAWRKGGVMLRCGCIV
jgi:hypothetical protein